MDAITLADGLSCLALAVALAACAGIRAWLPLLLAGVMARAELLKLGDSFAFIGSNKALVLFGAATLLEVLGDKIPAVDHTLDALGTVLRPAAGSLLAASVMWQVSDPLTALALGAAVGAPVAMAPHAAKAALRAASTTFTAGLANPVLSFLEDVLTVMLFVLAVLVPVLVAATLAVVALLVARRLHRRRAVVGAA
jgi:hypothetical protein